MRPGSQRNELLIPDRVQRMYAMWCAPHKPGEPIPSLASIGEKFGISKQRVHALLMKHYRLDAINDDGKMKARRRKMAVHLSQFADPTKAEGDAIVTTVAVMTKALDDIRIASKLTPVDLSYRLFGSGKKSVWIAGLLSGDCDMLLSTVARFAWAMNFRLVVKFEPTVRGARLEDNGSNGSGQGSDDPGHRDADHQPRS